MTEEYAHKLYPRVTKQEMLSVNSEGKEQGQVENIHNPTKTDSKPLNPFLQFYQDNSKTLDNIAMFSSYAGIGLHGLAAAAPILKFIPDPIKKITDQFATFYSRYLSGLPMVIFALPKFIAKDSIKALAQCSAAISFPFIKTVENMPVGSSLFCGVKTAIEAIEEYKGPKIQRKSDSLKHQAEEFIVNYGRMWKDSASKLTSNTSSISEKFRHFCNTIFLPGYSAAQTLGMLFCRGRLADQNQSPFLDGVARVTRTERGLLGTLTDFFLLGSRILKERFVGLTYVGSSLLSLTTPWVDQVFAKHPKAVQENILNVLGQTCKALDELGNVLWSKIPKEPTINNLNLAAVS
ncbi:MAG: hypothetical protein ACOYK1_04440 [Vampirovibrionia bacterium]|jgi:hypothetical protein